MTRVIERRSQVLGAAFDPRANSLNAVRLALAAGVIVWHSFPITGTPLDWWPGHQLLSQVWVDGFFAVSGYLIVSSWLRRPKWWPFLKARLLRILPAFYVCLILIAVVIAPAATLLSGRSLSADYAGDAVGFVFKNALLRITQFGIAGTPDGVPYPGVWDGSLWTLFWEFLCYLGVLAIGVAGLLKYRATTPLLFGAAAVGILLTSYGPIDNFYVFAIARFGIMFTAGALVHQLQDRLPVRVGYLLGALAIVLASSFLPDYRIVAALPLAYLLIGVGATVRHPRLRLQNDISYGVYIYAFPVQQILVMFGLAALGVPFLALAAALGTIPLAMLSWFFIEKPALRLRGSRAGSRA